MQGRFDFGRADLTEWRDRLEPMLAGVTPLPPMRPTAQLIKSMISSRTLDEVSAAAYHRLRDHFRRTAQLVTARPAEIERIIGDVTFADKKAAYIVDALRMIMRSRGDFKLGFLADVPMDLAIGWLEKLPGVGRKVAASVLNASTLALPVFIVDTHVMRVLGRLRFTDPRSKPRIASEAVTTTMCDWAAADFLRFHVQIKRLGQTICHAEEPECPICPLAGLCPKGFNRPRSNRPC